jgi:hypothetical protein
MLSRVSPSSFIEPCLPSSADKPPSGSEWVHEIKHDGYRLMARRDPITIGVRLLTRNGHDWAARYPRIVEAVKALKVRSCLIDGEAVACDENGVAVFERLRRRRESQHIFLYAFDLLELDGNDLRGEPFEVRKATLASLLRGCRPGLRLNEHLTHPGDVVFRHACKMGLEGIVSKRLGSRFRPDQGLAQVQESRRTSREAGGGGGLVAMSATKNRIMIFGPKDDGAYVVEFRTSEKCGVCFPPRTGWRAEVPRDGRPCAVPGRGDAQHCQRRFPEGETAADPDAAHLARRIDRGCPPTRLRMPRKGPGS